MVRVKRKRLDILLCERGLAPTRERAQALVLAGEVWSGDRRLDKAGSLFDTGLPLTVRTRMPRFASRGGEKLDHALKSFGIEITDRVCLDVGASSGGFTDCLLKRGAQHVFSVDVGYGQLDSRLRSDPRVSVLERSNARYLTLEALEKLSSLARSISVISIDISFISLTKVIPNLQTQFALARDWIVLFKPQFEVGREQVGKGGKVREMRFVEESLRNFRSFIEALGFQWIAGPEKSPLDGKKSGNLEYLIHYGTPRVSNPSVH